jgi:4-amino-4-deoxychorismate lyase
VNKTLLETIRCEDGKVFHLRYHQLRYEEGLKSLGAEKFQNLSQLLKPPSQGLFRARVLYTDKELQIEYIPYVKRTITQLKLIYDDSIEYAYKYANREELDKLFAMRENADDILIIKNNKITDTSIANIAFYNGKEWITPKEPLLKGTTRARLLDEGKIVQKDIYVKDIEQFSRLALLNAMIDFDIIAQENIRDIYC